MRHLRHQEHAGPARGHAVPGEDISGRGHGAPPEDLQPELLVAKASSLSAPRLGTRYRAVIAAATGNEAGERRAPVAQLEAEAERLRTELDAARAAEHEQLGMLRSLAANAPWFWWRWRRQWGRGG